jgi:gluconokinase
MIVLVMGISGSGKSHVGRLLAARLGWPFSDGDDFHSPQNKAKMNAGIPLDDADRWPWLTAIRQSLEQDCRTGCNRVLACSALKRSYRDYLRDGLPMQLVFLDGPPELLAERLATRRGHFFDPRLLQSQLDSLERPTPDEAWIMDIHQPPEAIVEAVLARLGW